MQLRSKCSITFSMSVIYYEDKKFTINTKIILNLRGEAWEEGGSPMLIPLYSMVGHLLLSWFFL